MPCFAPFLWESSFSFLLSIFTNKDWSLSMPSNSFHTSLSYLLVPWQYPWSVIFSMARWQVSVFLLEHHRTQLTFEQHEFEPMCASMYTWIFFLNSKYYSPIQSDVDWIHECRESDINYMQIFDCRRVGTHTVQGSTGMKLLIPNDHYLSGLYLSPTLSDHDILASFPSFQPQISLISI